MSFADRTAKLKPEGALQILAKAKALEAKGRSIIHLEIGEPDFDAPPNVSLAGIRAISSGQGNYTATNGLPALREAIAAYMMQRRKGMQIAPDQVVVCPGGKPMLFFPTMALVNPGDEVIYPDPGFPTYQDMVHIAGGVPIPVPLSEENNFSFDLDKFDTLVNEKTRLIVINTPGGNPTGGVIPLKDLEHIAAAAKKYDCWVLSDEIYERMVYDDLETYSIAEIPGMAERTIILNGFSKTYAMTGWRIGFGIMPAELAKRVGLLLTHSVSCTAEFTQIAAIEALTGDQSAVDGMLAAYDQRRKAIVNGLNAIPGVSCLMPQAAFYAFPNIKSFGRTSVEIADLMLEEAGVALLPGTAFGQYGEGYLRLSYANSLENIHEAVERMSKLFSKLN